MTESELWNHWIQRKSKVKNWRKSKKARKLNEIGKNLKRKKRKKKGTSSKEGFDGVNISYSGCVILREAAKKVYPLVLVLK